MTRLDRAALDRILTYLQAAPVFPDLARAAAAAGCYPLFVAPPENPDPE